MKKIWKKEMNMLLAGGLLAICLMGCGKDAAGSSGIPAEEIQQNNVVDDAQANNSIADDGASGSRGDGAFFEGASLQGDVVEFSETGFSLSPASTEEGGKVLAQTAPGSERDEDNIQITYTDNTVFQIVNLSMDLQSEISREDTDKESIKKQSSVCVFGSCQDINAWTADKILILRWQ